MGQMVKNIRGVNTEKEAIIQAALDSAEGREALADAMILPLRTPPYIVYNAAFLASNLKGTEWEAAAAKLSKDIRAYVGDQNRKEDELILAEVRGIRRSKAVFDRIYGPRTVENQRNSLKAAEERTALAQEMVEPINTCLHDWWPPEGMTREEFLLSTDIESLEWPEHSKAYAREWKEKLLNVRTD